MAVVRTTFRGRVLVLMLLCSVMADGVGCSGKPQSEREDPAVLTAALGAIQHRMAQVRDYELEGSVEDVASGQTLRFRYAMQQPQLAAATIVGARSFVFDGKVLAVFDEADKSAVRRDLSGNEQTLLLTLHEIFSQFVCEGWRPPLLKPQGTRAFVSTDKDGDRWQLRVPIEDAKLAENRIVLRAPGGDFVSREVVDKAGAVVFSTRVLEEYLDPATGLRFPRAWEVSSPAGGGTQRVRLEKITVNGGIAAERFRTEIPAGFTEKKDP